MTDLTFPTMLKPGDTVTITDSATGDIHRIVVQRPFAVGSPADLRFMFDAYKLPWLVPKGTTLYGEDRKQVVATDQRLFAEGYPELADWVRAQ